VSAIASQVPRTGEIVANKYRIEHVLGRGGMGVVVAARHLALGHRVAVKFLSGEAALGLQSATRALREAHAVVALSSEHVARVFDAGLLDDGAPYIVMEYLEGTDLAALLERDGPMAVAQAVDLVLQACEAIAEAHARGIVHRDLKPSNLFLVRRVDGAPLVKVLDFGISKVMAVAATAGSLTASGAILGSPYYMSPEQMTSSKTVDARTDVWAIGVILYELLTGKVPFPGETIVDIALKATGSEPPPLAQLRPDLPTALVNTILRCLRRDPAARWASIAATVNALVGFGGPSSRTSAVFIAALAGADALAPAQAHGKRSGDRTFTAFEAAAPVGISGSGGLGLQQDAGAGTMSPLGRTGAPHKRRRAWLAASVAVGATLLAMIVAGIWMVERRPIAQSRAAATRAVRIAATWA
jgi:serine/threonine-protein kinase